MEKYRGDRDGGGEVGGRHPRMASRWSSAGPAEQRHRYPDHSRGGGEGFAGGRHHPYRGSQDFPPGGRGGFRGGPDGFGHQMPMAGPRRGGGFSGRGGGSPDNADRSKFAKLFIGSVPRTATEEEIRPVFEEHGDVIEVALIKDKRTGQQQDFQRHSGSRCRTLTYAGCCFVKYATSEEADRAIKALHNQYTLPGGSGPIQVRYADGERERLVEHKLFVGSLNKQATEMEIEEIFSPYGHVEDIYIMRDDRKQSRGCGFVKFSNREMAAAAINGLNGTFVMRGCNQPLIVRFADPKRPRPGESRGGPAFGGPGFGPQLQAPIGVRPVPTISEPIGGPPKFAEPMSGGVRPNTWHPASRESMEPSPQASGQGFGSNLAAKLGDLTTSSVSMPIQQLGKAQIPQTMGFPSISQDLPSQQLLNLGAQLPASQALFPQTATANGLQIPLNLQQPGMAAASSQQQMPASTISQQQLQQPVQQLPSQLTQALLQQQAQALQLSFQSSQQAISQLQQQLQMIQPSGASQQQNSQTTKQQSPWSAAVSQSAPSNPVSTPTAVTSSNVSTTPPPVATQSAVPMSCDWSEHTSPDGYKYYYNCVTRESRWEKPEELTRFEEQKKSQQQMKLAAQHLQPPSQAQSQSPIQSTQVSQTQQTQSQVQLRQQASVQVLQPLPYQASGLASQQNNQDFNYAQFQAANSINDSARVHQAMQAGQEVMWKNMGPGNQ
ncbi:flowering time control protein FCA isoform X2 [Elaeis guineensis]|uniref:Flowering time control protein FCA isoform X2 n=1 Tax=Elaeis guineensis var. tenera TaxID=51953 RepID=A0A8N4ETV3_ELAGV|nr:flowering time control protein FCA isoform X2 [Elaeis guineensis]